MSAFRALDAARAHGIEIWLDGKDLLVSGSTLPTDIVDMLRRHKLTIVALLQPTQPWGSEDWLAFYGEKAAIGEYDHGMPRRQAEEHAVEHCISEWLYRNPASSKTDDGCVICGATDRPNDPLEPVGLGGGEGLVWLHRDCVPAWHSARMAEAASVLAAMGIRGPEGNSP